jgi:peptide-methionine (S)-S-oxide reductase
MGNLEVATFGAGCFWCVEAVFQQLAGVRTVVSGYMGGQVDNPTYREICTGTTGHAEVAQITFDPEEISYAALLEVLWVSHDPTTLNRQGADKGTQYRSAIFYHSDAQREEALKSKKEVAPSFWSEPIVTEITAASTFYEAEKYHQNYYNENINVGYCRVVISPKIAKVRQKFAQKLKVTQ